MTDETTLPDEANPGDGPATPSLLDAAIPVLTLIVLIATTIAIFGTDATSGPLQVALLTSAVVAAIVAFKNGHSSTRVREAAIGGISSALSAVFILLAIGSSWTTAATLGVAFIALAPLVGADPVITAGAVISGAYFGDKMSPVS